MEPDGILVETSRRLDMEAVMPRAPPRVRNARMFIDPSSLAELARPGLRGVLGSKGANYVHTRKSRIHFG